MGSDWNATGIVGDIIDLGVSVALTALKKVLTSWVGGLSIVKDIASLIQKLQTIVTASTTFKNAEQVISTIKTIMSNLNIASNIFQIFSSIKF